MIEFLALFLVSAAVEQGAVRKTSVSIEDVESMRRRAWRERKWSIDMTIILPFQ